LELHLVFQLREASPQIVDDQIVVGDAPRKPRGVLATLRLTAHR
jgi:hypothetical protein